MDTVVTCVYCGLEYPKGTPTSKNSLLTEHIKVCEKHPMKALKDALIGLVGAGTKEELDSMEIALRLVPAPGRDVVVMLAALDAIRSVI